MGPTGRVILAVLAGAAIWAVLWIAGTQGAQAAFPDTLIPDQRLEHTGFLAAYIVYSVVLSVLAGYVTAAVGGPDPMRAVWILASLQLALGLAFEISAWSLTPAWYHIIFLALIVPATVYGGRLRAGRGAVAGAIP